MRFGLVIYGSLETISGGYLYDRMLVEQLRASGHSVEVISQPWESYLRCLGHNYTRMWLERLASLQVDVLLEDELNNPSLFRINRLLRSRVAYPIVSIVHHLRSSEAHPGLVLRLFRSVERRYLESVDAFLYNSITTRAAVRSLLGRAPGPGFVATPGGDRLGPALDPDTVLARAYQPGPLRILFMGNLISRKGLATLIRALRQLPPGAAQLRVIGSQSVDPVYAARVHLLAQRLQVDAAITCLGSLSDEAIQSEMASAHVLAVPSQYEGFGIVYLEGMRFGLPAVGGSQGGAGEIIRSGDSGWLVHWQDFQELGFRLREWVEDRDKLARMSLEALRRGLEFPTWQESMRQAEVFLTGLK